MRFVLLASPFVGPGTWRAGARALSELGHPAAVVDLRSVVTPVGADLDAAGEAAAEALKDLGRGTGDPAIVVPHSGAGLLAPAVIDRLWPRIGSAVFVDAGVPPAGVDEVAVAPVAFRDRLRAIENPDGTLPPWARWWPASAMAKLVPDPEIRAALEDEMPAISAAYLAAGVPVPAAWPQVPGAYLAFGGEAYADDVERARSFGWPTSTIANAGHLHMVVDPSEVAQVIVALAESA